MERIAPSAVDTNAFFSNMVTRIQKEHNEVHPGWQADGGDMRMGRFACIPDKIAPCGLTARREHGATALFASGKVTDMHMKAKGRWPGDIAYTYASFCPNMDRDAARAMGSTDVTPLLENAGSHWAAITGWNEDSGDLGDAEEFEGGVEALSGDDSSDGDEQRQRA